MDRSTEHREFPSLEDRIRSAHAERSVAIGFAIGDALAAFWRVVQSLPFSPAAERPQARPRLARSGSRR